MFEVFTFMFENTLFMCMRLANNNSYMIEAWGWISFVIEAADVRSLAHVFAYGIYCHGSKWRTFWLKFLPFQIHLCSFGYRCSSEIEKQSQVFGTHHKWQMLKPFYDFRQNLQVIISLFIVESEHQLMPIITFYEVKAFLVVVGTTQFSS